MEEPKIFNDIRSWLWTRVDIYGMTYIPPKEIIVSQEVYDNVDYYYDEYYSSMYDYRPMMADSGIHIKGIKLVVGEVKLL